MEKDYYKKYLQERRLHLKAKGICVNCTKRPVKDGRTCCPECLDAKKLNKKFGSAERYKQLYSDLFEKQEGLCAICGEYMIKPLMDHCHDTEEVRGLLCSRCNTGLGFFKDDQVSLSKAVRYLNSSKTGIFYKKRRDVYRSTREKKEPEPEKEDLLRSNRKSRPKVTKTGYTVVD